MDGTQLSPLIPSCYLNQPDVSAIIIQNSVEILSGYFLKSFDKAVGIALNMNRDIGECLAKWGTTLYFCKFCQSQSCELLRAANYSWLFCKMVLHLEGYFKSTFCVLLGIILQWPFLLKKVSPPLVEFLSYTDGTYVMVTGSLHQEVIIKYLAEHMLFLKNQGMVTNFSKTEAVYFQARLEIKLDNQFFHTSPTMKVLGILFDHQLSWTDQVKKVYL